MENNCWRQVGVWGDRTCPKLAAEIHCHNCTIYNQVGVGLMERPEPTGYAAEWTALLAQPHQQQRDQHTRLSVTVFCVGKEWLALPANLLHQVVAPSPVHALPHRRDPLLRGIVNVRGQLLPCVSMHELLNIAMSLSEGSSASVAMAAPLKSGEQGGYPRLMVIKRSREIWAFEVDELYGLHLCLPEELRHPPALSNKALASFTESIFSWRDQNVSYLEAGKLFSALRQRAL